MSEATATATTTAKKKKGTRPERYGKQITVRVPPKVITRLKQIQRIHRLESLSGALRMALLEMLD